VNSAERKRAEMELVRARKSLRSAHLLLDEELFEDAVSRAYYAVLHSAKAALIVVGESSKSHKGVRILFGLKLVNTGKLEKMYARILTAEQEDREIGDYDIDIEIEEDRARCRVEDAGKFVMRIEQFLKSITPGLPLSD
jgi:uncharacterized protein (UPF0332 family)